jgi:hypothetical protein
MRNNDSTSKRILEIAKKLPSFGASSLAPLGEKKLYVNIILSRYVKRKMMIRLRKNLYVSKNYIDQAERKGIFSDYVEFIANKIYPPSYLSLDYVLYEHNMLTEIPRNMTSVGLRKTDHFSNELGNFIYHKIKEDLFCGFDVIKKGDFSILKATKAKALFDFLYFRKRVLVDRKSVGGLRLNLEQCSKKDLKELEGYVAEEGSEKMKEIINWLK